MSIVILKISNRCKILKLSYSNVTEPDGDLACVFRDEQAKCYELIVGDAVGRTDDVDCADDCAAPIKHGGGNRGDVWIDCVAGCGIACGRYLALDGRTYRSVIDWNGSPHPGCDLDEPMAGNLINIKNILARKDTELHALARLFGQDTQVWPSCLIEGHTTERDKAQLDNLRAKAIEAIRATSHKLVLFEHLQKARRGRWGQICLLSQFCEGYTISLRIKAREQAQHPLNRARSMDFRRFVQSFVAFLNM